MKKYLMLLAAAVLVLVGMAAFAEPAGIPVVALDGDCLTDYTNWDDKSTYYPATLSFTDGDQSFTKEIEIKPQGTSSLAYPKKNFTIKFSEAVVFADSWGAQGKYVLKADYVDPTHSSNVVSAKLAAEMNEKYGVLAGTPNHGVIDGFPVWVKINGQDAGIFNLTIPKDAWMLGMDENNANHLVLACEGWTDACTMLGSDIDFETDWTFEIGEPTDESKAAFKRVVEFVATSDDKTFVEQFDQYLDLDACLNYICFINTAYGHDNVTKNLLMATYDGKIWYPILYDLDSLWGINWDGTALAEPNNPWLTNLWSNRNNLFFRVKNLFANQLRERYWELREGILSIEHIMESFEAYISRIPQEYYEIDHALWNADGTRIRSLELMSQLMDEYLPAVDAHFAETAAAGSEAAVLDGPAIHYVWDKDGVLYSSEEVESLPASMTISHTLDGKAVSAQELEGKSGHLETVLHVERDAGAAHAYGVTAIVHVEEAQCENIAVSGGTYEIVEQEYVCMGSAWLGGSYNSYEMQLSMDVTDFDPAEYVVVVSPLHIDGGGDDDSMRALLATAGELTAIIDEGVLLHEKMVELHGYLTTLQNSLAATGATMQELLPSDAEGGEEDAGSIMLGLLADAEAEADAMLTALGYAVAEDAVSTDRLQMLSEVAASAERTEEEKAQASGQLVLIENYLAVADRLEKTQQTVSEVSGALTEINSYLPDVVDAYEYSNNQLYALVYRIYTLYQNLSDYYYANNGGGGDYDYAEVGDWYDVIVFTNYEGIAAR